MFPELKKRVCSFLVDEGGEVSKQSLLGLGVFLGAGVLVGSLSIKSVHADLCGPCGACACAACACACSSGGTACATPCAACTHSSHSSHNNSTHVNDLDVGYSGDVASATHSHHSSHSNS